MAFPHIEGGSFLTTREGLYSITKPKESNKVLKIITNSVLYNLDLHPQEVNILDCFGGIGGDSIRFGLNFKELFTVEKNYENFLALRNNLRQYGIKSHIYNKNILDVSYLIDRVSVVYIDPPWGGPGYSKFKNLRVSISGTPLESFVDSCLRKVNIIFLKLPTNFDFFFFKNHLNTKVKFIFHRISNWQLIEVLKEK